MAEASRHVERRGLIQLLFAALNNSFATGFLAGKIYQGDLKRLCAPGLNCYSCPGAVLSCPIGALQAVLSSRSFHISLYVGGILLVLGATLGRFVCGFLCPFGMIQEWIHRIPFPRKRNRFRGDKALRYLKYAMLGILVIALPMLLTNPAGAGSPAFCKWVCPAGTLEGGVPLVLLNPATARAQPLPAPPGNPAAGNWGFDAILQQSPPALETGPLFAFKMSLLLATLLGCLVVYRPFCKYVCPLGAVYGLMNPIALYRLRMESSLCIHCGKCRRACGMCLDPEHKQNEPECVRCGDCVKACPTGALSLGLGEKRTAPRDAALPKL